MGIVQKLSLEGLKGLGWRKRVTGFWGLGSQRIASKGMGLEVYGHGGGN